MSQDNPIFSSPHAFQQPMQTPPPAGGGNRRVLVVLAIVGAVGMAMCCGVGTLAYVALDSVTKGRVATQLPARTGAFAQDADRFNRSLAELSDDPCDDSGICEFVRRSAAAGNQDEPIPFSRSMFLEAIAKSHHSGGRLPVADRLMINTWLVDGEPFPDTEEFHRILHIEHDAATDLASVDLLFYTSDNQCESYQWFLVRENGSWKVYDWQRLEYGRRMSDEYAGYVKGVSPAAEGYDEVMVKLGEAQQLREDGEEQAAKDLLLACEQTPMLPGDLPVAKLRIAYLWLGWGENQQAVRVLESIQTPDQRWGVWPVLSMAYLNLGEYQTALDIAEKARRQSPQHPNVYWLLSEIYDGLDRTEEAADAALQAFVICPEDISLLGNVVYYGRPQDVPTLLEVLNETQSQAGWSRILNQASYSTKWGAALVEQLPQFSDVPLGAAEIAAGNLAWSQQDYDTAAKHFAAAKRTADQAFLQDMAASDYLYARMEEDRFAELLDEAEDVDETLLQLVRLSYDDEFYGDETALLQAIEQREDLSDNIWATALRGWVYSVSEQPEPALEEFARFADWLKANPDALDEDDQWLASTADYYLADSLLELKRPLDVLARWPEDHQRHEQMGTQLLQLRERSTINDFLQSTTDNKVDSVRLQRLRLQAELAFRDHQPQACQQLHQQVEALARQVYDESQSYQLFGLRQRRAADMVWASERDDRLSAIASVFELQDTDVRDALIVQVANQAYDVHDAELLEECRRLADAKGITELPVLAELQAKGGQLSLIEGRYQQAIDTLQVALDNTPDDERWDHERRRESLLSAYLGAQRFDEARRFATAEPSAYEGDVPTVALVDLASGDPQALRGYFDAGDRDARIEFGDWLANSAHRQWLNQYADQDWFDGLIGDVSLAIRSQGASEEGTLLFPAETAIAESNVEQFLQAAAGKPFQLTAVNLDAAEDNAQAWLATAEGGQRLVIHSRLVTCPNQGLQIEDAVALIDQVRALSIAVLDQRPQATRRLFAVAAAAAQDDAIGFWYESERCLWTQPELAKQLQWTRRLPIGPRVARNPLLEVNSLQPTDTQGYIDIEQWAQRLKDSEGPLSVSLSLDCGSVSEAVPCLVEDVDMDEYELLVRPTADSVLFPWIKQGVAYRSGVVYVNQD
ncbi:tetratricopeptide repeat protein [Roseimaritima ulvae]|uniref:Tetratricopeptide repeat protein n=1 Tax=Roseimaritima ulvae TaxID=980254 RepID=A0A5B9QLH2_9BACT|nr:hypothetical protein [Roseimaritima ulvae]QEG38375.1 Tetratricopeptide repeat protein [Roseimaritima ulvae]